VTEAGTSKNSNDFNDPQQADAKTYKKQLQSLVEKLKASGAELVFATTTPYPAGVKPARKPSDAKVYNGIAVEIMKKEGVFVNDLYSKVEPRLSELQKPVNVHFLPEGSKVLGEAVAETIKKGL